MDGLFKEWGKGEVGLESGKWCSVRLKVGGEGIRVWGGSMGGWEDEGRGDGEVVIG